MDLDGLKAILDGIAAGKIETVAIDTAEPSPLSHEILNANPYAYLDDAPLEERRARAVQMRRTLGVEAGQIGALDPAAIEEVFSESWPIVRDADELHDALLTLMVLPATPEWNGFFEELVGMRRAMVMRPDRHVFWVAAERMETVRRVYAESPETEAATSVVRGWMESTGPMTVAALAARLGLPTEVVNATMVKLESEGQVLRGHFTPQSKPGDTETEWCNRRLLARIHRLTLGRLRKEIEPVSAADFMRFLFTWQHVARGTQLHGADGTLQVIKQLQGYEVSASAWEADVLPKRVARYTPEMLDQLCLSGEVMWGRLSLGTSHSRPTRVAPVSVFIREDASWLIQPKAPGDDLSHPARDVVEALRLRGASFLPELVKASGRLKSEVEDALWELAAAGRVTADGFDNLRALVDPKRRRLRRHAAGRWTLLQVPSSNPSDDERTEAFARQFLNRWGVVFRDLLARESLAPAWRDLLVVLRRLEARGEIRGGRFVSGFLGEQFARPEAVDLLRAVRRNTSYDSLRIAAADPLNLAGIILPGPRISPLAIQTVELLETRGAAAV
jgi:ATP-dependent Lhr-like helicase